MNYIASVVIFTSSACALNACGGAGGIEKKISRNGTPAHPRNSCISAPTPSFSSL